MALSAPLLDVLGVDGGVFSLKGPSSKGKSTAQHTAASVWGVVLQQVAMHIAVILH